MQPHRLILALLTLALSIGGYWAGKQLASSNHVPISHELRGVWKGLGTFQYQGQVVESQIVLIVDGSNSRISITNSLDEASYTIDANLAPHSNLHENIYIDFKDRSTNGLEEFTRLTGLSVPPSPGLLSLQAWHLEKDSIFINVSNYRDVISSYKITKEHDLN